MITGKIMKAHRFLHRFDEAFVWYAQTVPLPMLPLIPLISAQKNKMFRLATPVMPTNYRIVTLF